MSYVLRHADCFDVLPTLQDKSIDLVLADLPYGTTACGWDVPLPTAQLWSHYRRVTKPGAAIVLTAVNPFASELIASNRAWFRYEWVWEKTSAKGHLSARNRPLRAHELVLVFSSGQGTYNPQKWQVAEELRTKRKTLTMTGSVGVYGAEKKQRRLDDGSRFPRSVIKIGNAASKVAGRNFHPTQKPVDLMEYFIKTYSNPGEVVLDNCMGSGTTGVAAIALGRSFIGIEREQKYFEIAEARLKAVAETRRAGSAGSPPPAVFSDPTPVQRGGTVR
jgi:site-specific DNA-methyltransferase (adenine-specific)